MRQFLVWDSEGVSEKHDTVVEDIFNAVDCDSSSESGDRKRKKSSSAKDKKKKKKCSSSEDEGNGSNDGSGNESEDEDDEKAWHISKNMSCCIDTAYYWYTSDIGYQDLGGRCLNSRACSNY